MQRLILTVEQARFLQREHNAARNDPESEWVWPGDWLSIYETALPELVDNLPDPDRTTAALQMMTKGCADEQVAEQLMWKPRGSTVKSCRRLHLRQCGR